MKSLISVVWVFHLILPVVIGGVVKGTKGSTPRHCNLLERECDGKCVPIHWFCDGITDCDDQTDESDCNENSTVIPAIPDTDISSTTEEIYVHTTEEPIPTTTATVDDCSSDEFRCKTDGCILAVWRCDGYLDCADFSDEIGCKNINVTCGEGEFHCPDTKICINSLFLCDNLVSCPLGEDEANCSTMSSPMPSQTTPDSVNSSETDFSGCIDGQFRCHDGPCIPELWKCDGEFDCVDLSDESACGSNDTSTSTMPPAAQNDSSYNSTDLVTTTYYDAYSISENTTEVSSNSTSTSCSVNQFTCNSGTCIPERFKCDFDKDCADGEDESICGNVTCSTHEYKCKTGGCIIRAWKCDGEKDCVDGDDEDENLCKGLANRDSTTRSTTTSTTGNDYSSTVSASSATTTTTTSTTPITVTCSTREYNCKSGGCIIRDWKCDGEKDCVDGDDEDENLCKVTCGESQFACNSGRCIPRTWVCDLENDCVMGEDEETCGNSLSTQESTTRSTTVSYFTTSTTDEEYTTETTTEGGCLDNEFRCDNGNCLPRSWRCDGARDCPDWSDEFDCENRTCNENEFRCVESGVCIPSMLYCDAYTDCEDGSDEIGCTPATNQIFTTEMYSTTTVLPTTDITSQPNATKSENERNFFKCGNGINIPDAWVCDHEMDCEDGTDENNCSLYAGNDSSSTVSASSATTTTATTSTTTTTDSSTSSGASATNSTANYLCSEDQFPCKSEAKCIPVSQRCNRVADCLDKSDELECGKRPCTHLEFRCNQTKYCIYLDWVCDGMDDCYDGSDETDCPGNDSDINTSTETLPASGEHEFIEPSNTSVTTSILPVPCNATLCAECLVTGRSNSVSNCPTGFEKMASSCIQLNVYPRSLKDAKLWCRQHNSHLIGPTLNYFSVIDLLHFIKTKDLSNWYYWISEPVDENFIIDEKDINTPPLFSDNRNCTSVTSTTRSLVDICHYLYPEEETINIARNCHSVAGFICELNDEKSQN